MGSNPFEKKYQKVPIEIGMSIAIAIGFVFFILFILPGAWAQGYGFFKNGLTPSSKVHLAFSDDVCPTVAQQPSDILPIVHQPCNERRPAFWHQSEDTFGNVSFVNCFGP